MKHIVLHSNPENKKDVQCGHFQASIGDIFCVVETLSTPYTQDQRAQNPSLDISDILKRSILSFIARANLTPNDNIARRLKEMFAYGNFIFPWGRGEACAASVLVATSDELHYATLGDASIGVYDSQGKLVLSTPNPTAEYISYLSEQGLNIPNMKGYIAQNKTDTKIVLREEGSQERELVLGAIMGNETDIIHLHSGSVRTSPGYTAVSFTSGFIAIPQSLDEI